MGNQGKTLHGQMAPALRKPQKHFPRFIRAVLLHKSVLHYPARIGPGSILSLFDGCVYIFGISRIPELLPADDSRLGNLDKQHKPKPTFQQAEQNS